MQLQRGDEENRKELAHHIHSEDKSQQTSSVVGFKLGLLCKSAIAIAHWCKSAGKSRDRHYRLKQLVSTEEDYLKVLIVLRDHVRRPLLQAQLLTEEEGTRIFANLDIMIELSEKLRNELFVFEEGWDRHRSMLGLVMKTYVRFFLVYKDYFRNMDSAQARIRRLLQEEPRAREIEQSLAAWGKSATFEDLLSRPFQRPLKYHLIIRDYEKKVPKGHPDKPALADTLKAFQAVNEDNNEALNKRDKGKRLQELDQRFGNIMIEGQASRTYESEFEIIIWDQMMDLFIFSDLLLISPKVQGLELRVKLDRWSSVRDIADGSLFNNQFIILGSDSCLHLSFLQSSPCQQCSQILRTIIRTIQVNEKNREKGLRGQTRLTAGTFTMTYLPPQVTSPLVAKVIGWETRTYFEDRPAEQVVVELSPAASAPGELVPKEKVVVPEEGLFKVEKMVQQLYPGITWMKLDSLPKGVTKSRVDSDCQLKRECRGILIEVMLNTFFRSATVVQRLDIFAHLLGTSQPLWAYLTPHSPCQICSRSLPVTSATNYHQQQRHRLIQKQLTQKRIFKKEANTRFCQFRTIQESLQLGRLPLSAVEEEALHGRLLWLKCRRGHFNHALSQPLPVSTRLSVRIRMCGVEEDGVEVEVRLGERVGQLLQRVEARSAAMLEDCMLLAQVGSNRFLLGRDEKVNDILFRVPQPGFLGFSLFQKDPLKVELSLRKILFLQPELQVNCPERELQIKLEEVIWRLRQSEVRLSDENRYAEVLACYYSYKHFIELDTLSYYLVKKRAEELDRFIPPRLRRTLPDLLYREIDKIKADKTLSNPTQLAKKVLRTVFSVASGSCYFFEAELRPDGIRVEVGADWEGVWVRDRSSVLFRFQFGKGVRVGVVGWELKLWADKQYSFVSGEMWKLKEVIDLLQDYYWQFYGKVGSEEK